MKALKDLKRELENKRQRIKGYKKVMDLFSEMIDAGLEHLDCNDIIFYDEKIAFEPSSNKQLTACRKFIKHFCPNWKDEISSIDNPYGNRCLVRYKFKGESEIWDNESNIEIWYTCTTDTVPKSLTKNDSCGFISRAGEIIDTTKVFVCKKTKEDK